MASRSLRQVRELLLRHRLNRLAYRGCWHAACLISSHTHLNGKVERSHKTDATEFYQLLAYKDDQDFRAKLRIWEDFYNLQRSHVAHSGKAPFESSENSVSEQDAEK